MDDTKPIFTVKSGLKVVDLYCCLTTLAFCVYICVETGRWCPEYHQDYCEKVASISL